MGVPLAISFKSHLNAAASSTLLLILLSMLTQPSNTHLLTLPLTPSGPADAAKEVLQAPSRYTSVHGSLGRGYCVKLLIGSPPQQLSVLIDTGSSNLGIASKPHPFLSSFFNTSLSSTFSTDHRPISVPYSQGEWKGYLGRDVVSLPHLNLSVHTEVSFITTSEDFFLPGAQWQGIWGLGYQQLALPPDGRGGQESLWGSLVKEGGFEDLFSLVLHPSMPHMTLGGVDEKEVEGGLHRVALRKEWYYEVVVAGVQVAGVNVDIDCKEFNFNKAIVDSGTTNLHFPPSAFQAIIHQLSLSSELPGKLFWQGRQSWCVSDASAFFNTLPNITISLLSSPSSSSSPHAVVNLLLPPQLYVRQFTSSLGSGESDESATAGGVKCFRSSISVSHAGCILGAVVMEAFVVVFDRRNKSLSFGRYKGAKDLPAYVMEGSTMEDVTECMYARFENDLFLINTLYLSSLAIAFCVVMVFVFVLVKGASFERLTASGGGLK